MAKQPAEHHHRFKIHFDIDADKAGPILATLTLMGVENVGYEVVTDIKAWGKGPQKRYDSTAVETTAAWMEKNPTFHVRELGQHFKDQGRSQTTAHYAVRVMSEKGLIRDLGDGNYQSMAIKHIEGPKPKALPAPPPKNLSVRVKKKAKAAAKAAEPEKRTRPPNPTARFEVTNRDLIEKKIKNRKRFTVKELQQFFRDEKRNDHSVSPILTKLIADKRIKMIQPGEYEVLPHNKANGAEPTAGVVTTTEVTEVAHG